MPNHQTHNQLNRPASRVLAALAVLLLAVCVEHLRAGLDTAAIALCLAPLVVLGTAVWGNRIERAVGERRGSMLRGLLGLGATLVVLAGTGVDSTSPLLLLITLPLIVIGARFGARVSTLAWIGTSLIVVGWSLFSWTGQAEPILEPIVTLVVIWLAASAAGSASSQLSERAFALETSIAESDRRADMAATVLQATADLVVADRDAGLVLVEIAERIVPFATDGLERVNRSDDRDLALRAVRADGQVVVEEASDGPCRLGVFVGGPRAEALMLAVDQPPTPLQIEALELLGMLVRGLHARDRSGAGEIETPSVARHGSRPSGEVSEFYGLLEASADDLIEAMFADPSGGRAPRPNART